MATRKADYRIFSGGISVLILLYYLIDKTLFAAPAQYLFEENKPHSNTHEARKDKKAHPPWPANTQHKTENQ